ncbi:MAG: DUF493 domain-containing protein [Deltaproteobacteria bacterium]
MDAPQGPSGPLIEYPTDYPFKVIGLAADDLEAHVRATVAAAVPGIALQGSSVRASGGGKYLSVTVDARLASEDQRAAVYRALAADPRVVHYL